MDGEGDRRQSDGAGPVGVVLPAGPDDDVLDTLESVLFWTPAPRHVVVVDDTQGATGLAARVTALSPDVVCIPTPARIPPGRQGTLFLKVMAGLQQVMAARPRVILRIDADALMIGGGSFGAAEARFAADPTLGVLGSFRINSFGSRRDFRPGRRIIASEISPRGWRHPRRWLLLLRLLWPALLHGYELGANALGGGYFLSPPFVRWLLLAHGPADRDLVSSAIPEDMLMALHVYAGGYRIGDFGGPGGPLALSWRGLPASPEDLLDRGKAIIHSVRFFEGRDEGAIRSVFAAERSLRGGAAAPTGSSPSS